MNDDVISRELLVQQVESLEVAITGLRANKDVCRAVQEYRASVLQLIDEQPATNDKIARDKIFWYKPYLTSNRYTVSIFGTEYQLVDNQGDPYLPKYDYSGPISANEYAIHVPLKADNFDEAIRELLEITRDRIKNSPCGKDGLKKYIDKID